jgi:hypothetical protein
LTVTTLLAGFGSTEKLSVPARPIPVIK